VYHQPEMQHVRRSEAASVCGGRVPDCRTHLGRMLTRSGWAANPITQSGTAVVGYAGAGPEASVNQGRPPIRMDSPYGYVSVQTGTQRGGADQSVVGTVSSQPGSGQTPSENLPDLFSLSIRGNDVILPTTTWEEVQSSPLRPYWIAAYAAEVRMWEQRGVFDTAPEIPSDKVRLSCRRCARSRRSMVSPRSARCGL